MKITENSKERGAKGRGAQEVKDIESRRRDFEHATWKRANKQKHGGGWPVLYNAGELGYCLLDWASACGGHWVNRWFDRAEELHVGSSVVAEDVAAEVVAFDAQERTITLRFDLIPCAAIGERWMVRPNK